MAANLPKQKKVTRIEIISKQDRYPWVNLKLIFLPISHNAILVNDTKAEDATKAKTLIGNTNMQG